MYNFWENSLIDTEEGQMLYGQDPLERQFKCDIIY